MSAADASEHGAIPKVDPADMKAAWQAYRDAQSRRPCDHIVLADKMLAQACSKGADLDAISFRLGFMRRVVTRPEMFRFLSAGQPTDNLIHAFAQISMAGSGQEGFPFEMKELLQLCSKQ